MQRVLYTAQNVRSRVGCAKSALYNTKCTLESRMFKKCSTQCKMRKKKVLYPAQNARLRIRVLYTAQNVRSKVGCTKRQFLYIEFSGIHFVLKMAIFVHGTLKSTFCAVYGSFCTLLQHTI